MSSVDSKPAPDAMREIPEAALWALIGTLHENVPEDDRPMSWSDFSDEQAARLKRAASAFVAALSAPVQPPDGAAQPTLRHHANETLEESEYLLRASTPPPSDDVRSALAHAELRFRCLVDHFKEIGEEALEVMSEVDAERMQKGLAALRSATVSAPATLIESLARLQRRLMSYCNHANAGHMPSDAREFARRIQLGFLAAYEEAGVTPPTIEPETHAEYMASLLAPAVGVTWEAINGAVKKIQHVKAMMQNDDLSEPQSEKRARLIFRQETLSDIEELLGRLAGKPTIKDALQNIVNAYDRFEREHQQLDEGVEPAIVAGRATLADDDEVKAHYYNPSPMHMGDCKICGHVEDSVLHIGTPKHTAAGGTK